MIRALASLIVVCLVAATGVRPVAAAEDQRSTLSVPHKVEKLHARPVHAALRRTPEQAPEIPAVVVVGALALVPLAARPAGVLVDHVVSVAIALETRSARGPPIL